MKNKSLTTGLIWAAILAAAMYLTSCTVNHYYVFVIKERPADEIHSYQPLIEPRGFQYFGVVPFLKNNPLDSMTPEQLKRMCQVPGINNWINEPTLIDSSKIIIDHEK